MLNLSNKALKKIYTKQILEKNKNLKTKIDKHLIESRVNNIISNKKISTAQKLSRLENMKKKAQNSKQNYNKNVGKILASQSESGKLAYGVVNSLNKFKQKQYARIIDDNQKKEQSNLKDEFIERQENIEKINDTKNDFIFGEQLDKQIEHFFWATNRDVITDVPYQERYAALQKFYDAESKEEMWEKWVELYRDKIEELLEDYNEYMEGKYKGDEEVYDRYEVIYVQSTEMKQNTRNNII